MDMLDQILMYAVLVLEWAAIVVGGASLIVAGLTKITDLTPSTRDDLVVGQLARWVLWAERVLDRIALNLPRSKARLD